MKINGSGLGLVIGLLLGAGGGYFLTSKYVCVTSGVASNKAAQLDTALRKLWADHVIWTREFIICSLEQTPDAQAASDRLMSNQEDIGHAMAGYYGKEAGDQLTKLLKDHINLATSVVVAAATNDQAKLKSSEAAWHKNADDIAHFLSTANPYWTFDDIKNMLYTHLKVTTDEAVARIKKDWNGDVKAFDAVFNQIMGMADMLAAGIVKQFPEKF